MRALIVALCCLSTTGCLGRSATSPAPIDSKVVLAPGGDAAIDPALSVRFVEVAGDSRCPADAVCITAGDATVRVEVRTEDVTATRDLHTGLMQPVTVEDVRIELLRLEPSPFSSHPIDPAEYRATLRVVR
jgi:hypothetical protein